MFQYSLQPYKGPGSRYKCPECGKPREFARYVNTETNELLPDHVGRCNREGSCGYHYTASQYFKDNQIDQPEFIAKTTQIVEVVETFDLMEIDLVNRSLSGFMYTNFAFYLRSLFGAEITEAALLKYLVGRSKMDNGKGCIFWRIDIDEEVRTGKIMAYNPTTGKRNKEINPTWAHIIFKNYKHKLCFFGEHLLKEFPEKQVAIVESEKTAVISSIYMPSFNWIATGGASGCKWREYSVFKVLQGKDVVLFPDFGYFNKKTGKTCFEEWTERSTSIMERMERMDCRIKVSRVLEDNIPAEERSNDYDLADMLINKCDKTGLALVDEGYPAMWELT